MQIPPVANSKQKAVQKPEMKKLVLLDGAKKRTSKPASELSAEEASLLKDVGGATSKDGSAEGSSLNPAHLLRCVITHHLRAFASLKTVNVIVCGYQSMC